MFNSSVPIVRVLIARGSEIILFKAGCKFPHHPTKNKRHQQGVVVFVLTLFILYRRASPFFHCRITRKISPA
jgi:hypothetical protein